MIIFVDGFILYTLGGAALLIALMMFFPKLAIKEAKNYSEEKRKSMRKPGVVCGVIGIALIVLGFIFKF